MLPPDNLFQLILKAVEAEPHRLSMHHYHELHGREAISRADIQHPECKHCLLGWVVRFTSHACGAEQFGWVSRGRDPGDLANEILVNGGKQPLPSAVVFADVPDALRTLRHLAAQERQKEVGYGLSIN